MNGVQLLLVVVACIGLSAFARRHGASTPVLLVVTAAAVSFIPGLPRFQLDHEVIFGVVMPPLVYAAARKFSLIEFARHLRSIIALGVGLVLVSAAAVGLVAWWVVPGLGLPAAVVLGAVVAPPDTVTAVAHGRAMGLPRRVIRVLTGESLVNDAAALALFTVAVAGVTGVQAPIGNPVLLFGYEVVGGVVVGSALGAAVRAVRARMSDASLSTAAGLILPFASYLTAEQVRASGVIAVVLAGFAVGSATLRVDHATRIRERELWPTIETLLESFVFAYMGLQLKFVLDELGADGGQLLPSLLVGVLVLLVVLVVRPVWVMVVYGRDLLRRRAWRRRSRRSHLVRTWALRAARNRLERGRRPQRIRRRDQLSWKDSVVVSWVGMRGIVTLAAAAAVPAVTASGLPFTGRPLIQVCAYVVAVGTLVVQTTTLPILLRRLRLNEAAELSVERGDLRCAERAADPHGDAASLADRTAALVGARDRGDVDGDAAEHVLVRLDLERALFDAT